MRGEGAGGKEERERDICQNSRGGDMPCDPNRHSMAPRVPRG